jgi:hypothetical protein
VREARISLENSTEQEFEKIRMARLKTLESIREIILD